MSSARGSDRDLVSLVVFGQKRTPYGALGSRALLLPSEPPLYPCDLSRRSFDVGGSVVRFTSVLMRRRFFRSAGRHAADPKREAVSIDHR